MVCVETMFLVWPKSARAYGRILHFTKLSGMLIDGGRCEDPIRSHLFAEQFSCAVPKIDRVKASERDEISYRNDDIGIYETAEIRDDGERLAQCATAN